MYWYFVIFFFFFFKQKTAYEILRSDWSSDVCSSDLLHQLLVQRLPQGRVDDAGGEAVDGDVVLGELACAHLRHGGDAELADAVGDDVRIQAGFADDRAGVDDLSGQLALAALADHLLGGLLHADHDAPGVDAHHEVPVLLRGLEEVLRLVHARVVEHHVEAAPAVHGGGDHGGGLLAAADVDGRAERLAAERVGGRLGGFAGAGFVHVGEDDLGALLDQRVADGAPHALRGSGDDDDLSFGSTHGGSPFLARTYEWTCGWTDVRVGRAGGRAQRTTGCRADTSGGSGASVRSW